MEQNKLDKLKKLKDILELLSNDTITPSKLAQFITAVSKVVKDSKESMENVSEDVKNTLNDALIYLENSKEWLYVKIMDSIAKDIASDWIIIVDSIDFDNLENNKGVNVRTLLISSDHPWYNGFNNMFFKFDDLIRGAIMNLQSDHEALKEVAYAIIKGEGAQLDTYIKFPYTLDCWKH